MNGKQKTKVLTHLNDVLRRAKDIEELSTNSPEFQKWCRDAMVAISYAFGEDSRYVTEFKKINFLPIAFASNVKTDWDGPYRRGVRFAEATLRSMVEEVEEYWDEDPTTPAGKALIGTKVFLIQGRDEAARSDVARFLERLGLEVVILAEQPSGGRTIIEKVEAHDEVGYAVALLTPDDVGSALGDDAVQPRARQNVIFELGYFIGRLGRERVCALTKGQPEIPSDYSGVVYIPMADAWTMELIKELKAAGLDVDANKAFP